ncbi:hypothetical protein [Parafrigoribacterium soli]|uniref:hypothetical protein n=1 Tax=Parafrigoribacterium soli TaxID=3144663 RepID=UPI0032EF1229
MSQVTRCWLSFAAIGSGIVHLALVISSPLPLAIPLLVLGVAELVWAVSVLVKDRVVTARLAQIGATAPLILWSLLVVVATMLGTPQIASPLRFVPMAIAAAFELFIAGVLGVYLRRLSATRGPDAAPAPAKTPPAKTQSAGRYLAAVFVGGLLVGALTTPALAATQAGTVAQEHGGTMGGMMMMDMPGMGH